VEECVPLGVTNRGVLPTTRLLALALLLDPTVSTPDKAAESAGTRYEAIETVERTRRAKKRGGDPPLFSYCLLLGLVWIGAFPVTRVSKPEFLNDTVTDIRHLVAGQAVFVRIEQLSDQSLPARILLTPVPVGSRTEAFDLVDNGRADFLYGGAGVFLRGEGGSLITGLHGGGVVAARDHDDRRENQKSGYAGRAMEVAHVAYLY